MPLTYDEREVCRHATFLKGCGHGYGSPEEGYCPIGAVAAMRGAVFHLYRDGEYTAQATVDILDWLNMESIYHFLDALSAHGTTIFPPEPSVEDVP